MRELGPLEQRTKQGELELNRSEGAKCSHRNRNY